MNLQSLIMGVPSLVSGLGMLLFPRKRRLAAQARAKERKIQLEAGVPERYFEEKRALHAYPLPATDLKWRIKGGLLAACGVALLVLSFVR